MTPTFPFCLIITISEFPGRPTFALNNNFASAFDSCLDGFLNIPHFLHDLFEFIRLHNFSICSLPGKEEKNHLTVSCKHGDCKAS